MTNSVVPKNTRADAERRTPLVVVRTTGSRTVTPLTVCGNDDWAAFVRSASVTTRLKVVCGAIVAVRLAVGSGVTERVGVALGGDAVVVGDGNTTRDGTQPRVTTIRTRSRSARKASRATDPTRYQASRRSCRPSHSQ